MERAHIWKVLHSVNQSLGLTHPLKNWGFVSILLAMVRSTHKMQACLLVLDRVKNKWPVVCFSSIVPALVFQSRVSNQGQFVLKGFLFAFVLTRALRLTVLPPNPVSTSNPCPCRLLCIEGMDLLRHPCKCSTSSESLYSLI